MLLLLELYRAASIKSVSHLMYQVELTQGSVLKEDGGSVKLWRNGTSWNDLLIDIMSAYKKCIL